MQATLSEREVIQVAINREKESFALLACTAKFFCFDCGPTKSTLWATDMLDTSSKGIRCRAAQEIRSNSGIVTSSTEGTIQYEIENLGRNLIFVEWDSGLRLFVFPSEIEIIGGDLFLWQ